MYEQLEAKRALFNSIDEMISPETLSTLLDKSITRAEREQSDYSGNAGSEFSFVQTNAGKLVLKTMSLNTDWEMFATDDFLCRSVTLWQYGLLDQVQSYLQHKIIACAKEGDTWAILMKVVTDTNRFTWTMDSETISAHLNALARLHAKFWNDERLRHPCLGLGDPGNLIQLSSPQFSQKHNEDRWGHLPDWVIGGWKVMEEYLDSDVFSHMKGLVENPQPLLDALARYPFTLLHGDYYPNNLSYQQSQEPVAIDWQLSLRSLMTIDLARLISHLHTAPAELVKLQNEYRTYLETYLNRPFDSNEWQIMIDLGCLVDVLWITCYVANWFGHTENPDDKKFTESRLNLCNQLVRNGVRWLS